MKTKVYFTVDTESSMGGAWQDPRCRPVPAERHVFCRAGDREYGIPLIVDLLDRYGFRGTFFVETLATRLLGYPDTRSIFDYLLERGQDVQLHVHPTYHFYSQKVEADARGVACSLPESTDLIGRLPKELQLTVLSDAVRFFRECAGFKPAVFRAGSWAADRRTLQCLAELEIPLDSSWNPRCPSVSFPGEKLPHNCAQRIEGVWEIPATVARSPLREGANGLKQADCTSLSFRELAFMLDAAAEAGQEHFVITFHSFSAVKPKDLQYSEVRPNRIVARRLRQLFEYLARNPNVFEVTTMGEIAAKIHLDACVPGVVPRLELFPAMLRKAVQFCNNRYWL